MVDHPGEGQTPNARFHTPFAPIATESKGRDTTKYAPHIPIQEAHPTRQNKRGAHSEHRESTPHPTQGKPNGGHEPPQIHTWPTIQRQTCQTLRARAN